MLPWCTTNMAHPQCTTSVSMQLPIHVTPCITGGGSHASGLHITLCAKWEGVFWVLAPHFPPALPVACHWGPGRGHRFACGQGWIQCGPLFACCLGSCLLQLGKSSCLTWALSAAVWNASSQCWSDLICTRRHGSLCTRCNDVLYKSWEFEALDVLLCSVLFVHVWFSILC